MKIAVVGGGSTYTPELVDGFARLRDELPVAEIALVDPDEHRLELVGGLARRMLRPARASRHGRRTTSDLDEGVDGAGGRAAPAARRRPGGPRRGRDAAAGVRLRRPGDDRRGRAGQGAAHGAGRAGHRRAGPHARARTPGSSTSPTRSASSPGRCWTPATGRSGCATWRSASSAASPPTAGRRRPSRISLGHVGLNHLTWERAVLLDGVDVLPRLLATTPRRSPPDVGLPAGLIRRLGVVPVLLPALLLRARPVVARAAGQAVARRRGRGDGDAAARDVRRPGGRTTSRNCWASAAGRTTPRPRSRWSPRCSATAATLRWSTSATTARCRSWPTRRSSRFPPRSPPTGAAPLPVGAGRAAVRRAHRPRHRLRDARPGGGAARRRGPRRGRAAGPPADRAGRASPRSWPTASIAANRRAPALGERVSNRRWPSTAATARPTSRWSAEDGYVLAEGRGAAFEPQSVGVGAAVDVDRRRHAAAHRGPAPPSADHVAAYLAGADLPGRGGGDPRRDRRPGVRPGRGGRQRHLRAAARRGLRARGRGRGVRRGHQRRRRLPHRRGRPIPRPRAAHR